MLLGLDLGSTGGKFALGNGLTDMIPAVVGDAEEIWEWKKEYIEVEYGWKKLFVGLSAMEQADEPLFALQNNKMERQTVEQVLYATLLYIAQFTEDDVLDIVATLPFGANKKQKETLSQMLQAVNGQKLKGKIGGQKMEAHFTVRRLYPIPEGYAGWCNYVLDDDGSTKRKERARERVCVNDIGLFHWSQLVIDNMTPLGRPFSRSTSMGLHHAHIAASRQLGGIDVWRVDEGIRNRQYDGSAAFEKFAQRVNQDVINLENRQGYKFPFYYWTGGGSSAISKWLKQSPRELAEDATMDNALGCVKVGRRKWERGPSSLSS